MGADNAEKQGQCTFFSPFPLSHLASTKGCYVTAIYTRAPFPSRPPSSCQAAPREIQMVLQPCAPSRPFLSLIRLLQIMPHSCNLSQVKTGWRKSRDVPRGREAKCLVAVTECRQLPEPGPCSCHKGPGGVSVPYMQAKLQERVHESVRKMLR